eukprot:6780693-Ditylum_brightwellii.AAC.1
MEQYEDPLSGHLDYFYPIASVAKLKDSNTLNWSQATRGRNSKGFWESMWVEIATFLKIKAFEIVPCTADMHAIMST